MDIESLAIPVVAPAKEETIEGICFYASVKVWRDPMGGFAKDGWVLRGSGGYLDEYDYECQPNKTKAHIFLDLFDAVLMAAVKGVEVWAVNQDSEE